MDAYYVTLNGCIENQIVYCVQKTIKGIVAVNSMTGIKCHKKYLLSFIEALIERF